MDCGYNYTPLGQLKVYNRTIRQARLLSADSQAVLLFILDRTIGWRKVWEAISFLEFQNGIFRRRGGERVLVAPGAGLSTNRAKRAIAALRLCGAIEVMSVRSKQHYRIVPEWHHCDLTGVRSRTWELNETDYVYDD